MDYFYNMETIRVNTVCLSYSLPPKKWLYSKCRLAYFRFLVYLVYWAIHRIYKKAKKLFYVVFIFVFNFLLVYNIHIEKYICCRCIAWWILINWTHSCTALRLRNRTLPAPQKHTIPSLSLSPPPRVTCDFQEHSLVLPVFVYYINVIL